MKIPYIFGELIPHCFKIGTKMKSLWNTKDAAGLNDLAMRVYASRLLGQEEGLVLHGGGNTSVKTTVRDFFGREVEILLVKGSGWDLKTIENPGFAPLRLQETRMLAQRETLSDEDMVKQLRALLLDPSAPAPSVEAILHAIMAPKFIDHTHTDAVVTLTNNPHCDKIMAEVYPDCLILPYVMPGFVLAKQVYESLRHHDISDYKGIILLHHGVFTYSDNAQEAYETMIELVTRAEDYIAANGKAPHEASEAREIDLLQLAAIRKQVSKVRGCAQIAKLDHSGLACAYSQRTDIHAIATRGPITPDHVIRTKRIPVIIEGDSGRNVPEVDAFVAEYRACFARNAWEGLQILDAAPRAGIWKGVGTLAFGSTLQECDIVQDIARHTCCCVQTGESLGGWKTLSEKEIFELEYWSLEQAKLKKKAAAPREHLGKIAVVTGAAGGIGKATCEKLHAEGAVVVALDIDPSVVETFCKPDLKGVICDVTHDADLKAAIQDTVAAYGGIDIIVCNAGIFESGETVEEMTEQSWDRTLAINLTATQRFMKHAIPYLKLGVNPTILIVGSRNVSAPGPGAGAYSASKAAVVQLGRVAALELAGEGIRVNLVHPDAVFDTGLWTQDALQKSAKRYHMSVEEYKTKNLLGAAIKAKDVARLLSAMAGEVFAATTGAQVPIDGGNDRVI